MPAPYQRERLEIRITVHPVRAGKEDAQQNQEPFGKRYTPFMKCHVSSETGTDFFNEKSDEEWFGTVADKTHAAGLILHICVLRGFLSAENAQKTNYKAKS